MTAASKQDALEHTDKVVTGSRGSIVANSPLDGSLWNCSDIRDVLWILASFTVRANGYNVPKLDFIGAKDGYSRLLKINNPLFQRNNREVNFCYMLCSERC
jgi:hypothetical protein